MSNDENGSSTVFWNAGRNAFYLSSILWKWVYNFDISLHSNNLSRQILSNYKNILSWRRHSLSYMVFKVNIVRSYDCSFRRRRDFEGNRSDSLPVALWGSHPISTYGYGIDLDTLPANYSVLRHPGMFFLNYFSCRITVDVSSFYIDFSRFSGSSSFFSSNFLSRFCYIFVMIN